MIVSTKNIQEVCSFIVASCSRAIKDSSLPRKTVCEIHRNKFTALSLLLVGSREKRYIDDAVNEINCIEHSVTKK